MTEALPVSTPTPVLLQPPSSLLMGPPGSGKTTVLATYLKNGIETFVISTEPGGIESLVDEVRKKNYDMNLLHWAYIPPASPGWGALKTAGSLANTMSYKDLSDLKSGIGREHMKSLAKLFSCCEDFVDDRTGKSFGPIEKLGPTAAVCLDSLSGLNHICMQNTVGFKPSPHQGEWGIAMGLEENILLKLSSDLTSFFTVTAHIDREPDEILGTNRITVSAIGRKLGPKIPRYFGDVIFCSRNADAFTWSTMSSDVDLKNRALPASKTLTPDFTPIVAAYRARVEAAQGALPRKASS